MALLAGKARSLFCRMPAAPLLRPGLLLLLLANLASLAHSATTADKELSLFEQRALYQQALDDLRRGAVSKFRAKAKRLDNYPLRPYLDYHLVNGRLNRASAKEIRNFMDEHSDLAPSDIICR